MKPRHYTQIYIRLLNMLSYITSSGQLEHSSILLLIIHLWLYQWYFYDRLYEFYSIRSWNTRSLNLVIESITVRRIDLKIEELTNTSRKTRPLINQCRLWWEYVSALFRPSFSLIKERKAPTNPDSKTYYYSGLKTYETGSNKKCLLFYTRYSIHWLCP